MNPTEPAARTEPAEPMLRVDGLCKRYGERSLLRALSLHIPAGGSVALLGESGSGKSTLLNLIAGLEPVDSGQIAIDGVQVPGLSPDAAAGLRRRALGFVFQAFHLIPHLDALRNVAVPLLLIGMPEREALARAAGMLARTGLAHRTSATPSELSGGEQQRVALARALVHRPRLLLADEPTGNLDPDTADLALQLLAREVRESGASMLMVTHSTQAAAIADRRLRLVDGALHPA